MGWRLRSATRGVTATPILASMVVGALVGWLIGPTGSVAGLDVLPLFDFLGTLFINMLKMVVVPLISASIITACRASAREGISDAWV
jgi:proton glutamate symport protein